MCSNKLKEVITTCIKDIKGTRKYLPIDDNESILVFERRGYFHIVKGVQSIYGSKSASDVVLNLITHMKRDGRVYHEDIIEKVS